jgi:hypothetical protein
MLVGLEHAANHRRGQMPSGFSVDLTALSMAVSGINGTLDEVAQRDVAAVNCASSAYGHDGLASTMADFCDRWQLGVTNLASDAQAIATQLNNNLQAYELADTKLSEVFQSPSGSDPAANP